MRRPPNVIWLMSDQHRAQSCGAYGSREARTPHLDEFAAAATVLERAYCQYPQCVASRQSLLTGQYPSRHGAHGVDMGSVNPAQWTVPQAFAAAGYHTALIGKAHCNERGFAENHSEEELEARLPAAVRAQVRWPFFGMNYRENARTAAPLAFAEEHLPDTLIWQEAVAFLQRRRREPFFLLVSFPKPHPPFNPPRRFWDWYDPARIELPPVDPNRPRHPFWPAESFTPAMQRNYLHGYFASISYMDWCVGQVLRAIRAGGYGEDSVIVYVSDHGENGGWHGSYEKHCFYEPSVRVPLLIRVPDRAPRRIASVVELIDLAPTLLEVCGAPATGAQLDGRSLAGLLAGAADGWKDRAICEYYEPVRGRDGTVDVPASFGRMLVQDGFKCCVNGNMADPNSLFDLQADPCEFRNLWDSPLHRARRDRMLAVLEQDWRREWFPYARAAPR